jgi:hypothetical protein
MGRPKGSKNKPKPNVLADAAAKAAAAAYQSFTNPQPAPVEQKAAIKDAASPPEKRRRGRPPGSKNKPKELWVDKLNKSQPETAEYRPTTEQIAKEMFNLADESQRLALAKVGITALVDEATKYQEERPKDALQQKLEEESCCESFERQTGGNQGDCPAEHPIATKLREDAALQERAKASEQRRDKEIVISAAPEVTPSVATPAIVTPLAEQLDQLYKEAAKDVEKMRGYFRAPEYQLPERLVNKLDAILKAADLKEGQKLAEKALFSIHLNFLGEWGEKRIPGPIKLDTAETQARKAEQLADFLESRGETDNAVQQRERARQIRAHGKGQG